MNGTSPPYSTPKPVRFIIAQRDPQLALVSPSELTWALCHDYPNWYVVFLVALIWYRIILQLTLFTTLFRTGPIKLPSPVQLAHKLAELAGGMQDCGKSIDHSKYAGKIYFL